MDFSWFSIRVVLELGYIFLFFEGLRRELLLEVEQMQVAGEVFRRGQKWVEFCGGYGSLRGLGEY